MTAQPHPHWLIRARVAHERLRDDENEDGDPEVRTDGGFPDDPLGDELEDETIRVCPECNSAQLRARAGGIREEEGTGGWWCADCHERLERGDAVVRERRRAPSTRGLARKLEQADPDAVSDSTEVGR